MSDLPPSGSGVRTYLLEELRRNAFLVGAAVIAVIGLLFGAFALWVLGAFGLEPLDLIIAGVPTVLLLGVALAVARAALSIRLELTPAGLVLRVPGAVVTCGWEDVASLGPAPWGLLSGQALILRRPAHVAGAWWFHLVGPASMDRAIPLSPFALPLRGSRLEADLASRLPALFADVTAA